MSEFPSNNHESFDAREQLALLDLIEAVQNKVHRALSYEEKLRQLSVQEGHAGARTTNIAKHVNEGNEQVSGPHHLVIWEPEYGERPLFGITRLEVRAPDNSDSDFFLRLYDSNENEQNFLLNNKGMTPFNIASTDIEPTDFLDYDTAQFAVKEGTVCEPAIVVGTLTLDAIINSDSYKYFEQPRDPDNERPWGQVS